MLKKVGLVLISLLVLASGVSAESLIVKPDYLNLTIDSGRLDTCRLRVINYSDAALSIRTDFDSQWMYIFPPEFNLPSRADREIWAIFFIPRDEEPQREREIVFTGDHEQAKVKVEVSAPKDMPVVREEIEKLKKERPYKEVTALKNEVKFLREEIHKREQKEQQAKKSEEELKSLFEFLVKSLQDEIERNEVQLGWREDHILISIPGQIIFASGEIYPKEKSQPVLEKIGSILKEKASDRLIEIRGHTDTFPISKHLKEKFVSNWELSSARASAIARILQHRVGIDGKYLIATGCSSHYPITDNRTVESRAKNRRIEIVVSVSE